MDQRERSNKELKSKGRVERRFSGESKVKGFQYRKTSPRQCPAFGKGINLFYSQVGQGQTVSPGAEQRHFGLQTSREAGSSKQVIEYDCNSKSKSKAVFQHRSELAFSLQQNSIPQSCGKENEDLSVVRWIFLGVSTIFASV